MLLIADYCSEIFSVLDTEDMTLESIKRSDLLRIMKSGFHIDNITVGHLMLMDIYDYDFYSFDWKSYVDGNIVHLGNLYRYFRYYDALYCYKNYGISYKCFDSDSIVAHIYINGVRYRYEWYNHMITGGTVINNTIFFTQRSPRYVGYCENISSVILGCDDSCLAFTEHGVYRSSRMLSDEFGIKLESGIPCTIAGFKRYLLSQ